MDNQLKTNWPEILNGLVHDMCPDLNSILPLRPDYYFSADETEWSTDMMFNSSEELDKLYPSLIYHAMCVSDSPAVMRYFGRRDNRGMAPEEIVSDYRSRYECACQAAMGPP